MGIQWSEGILIGHPIIDAEHNAIIEKINDLEALIGCDPEKENLAKLYGDVVEYFSEHFIREEQIMQSAKYPDIDRHILSHDELFSELSKMAFLFENDIPETNNLILKFLHKWFFGHVVAFDRVFVEFLASQPE